MADGVNEAWRLDRYTWSARPPSEVDGHTQSICPAGWSATPATLIQRFLSDGPGGPGRGTLPPSYLPGTGRPLGDRGSDLEAARSVRESQGWIPAAVGVVS